MPEGSEAVGEAERVYGDPLCDNPSQNSQDLFSNVDVSLHVVLNVIAIVLRHIPVHVMITQYALTGIYVLTTCEKFISHISL